MKSPLYLAATPLLLVSSLNAASWAAKVARGNSEYDRGFYSQAAAEYDDALALSATPWDRAVTLYRLALAHKELANWAGAERDFSAAHAIFQTTDDFRDTALSLAGLGEVYRAQKHLANAFATEEHALAVLNQSGSGNSPQAAQVLAIKGAVLHDQRRIEAARHVFEQALRIFEKTVEPDHPDVAMALNNLGVIASEEKHFNDAEKLLNRALAIREARFGPDHPLVASTLISLSTLYTDQKRYVEAERAGRRAMAITHRFFPDRHPDEIATVSELKVR